VCTIADLTRASDWCAVYLQGNLLRFPASCMPRSSCLLASPLPQTLRDHKGRNPSSGQIRSPIVSAFQPRTSQTCTSLWFCNSDQTCHKPSSSGLLTCLPSQLYSTASGRGNDIDRCRPRRGCL